MKGIENAKNRAFEFQSLKTSRVIHVKKDEILFRNQRFKLAERRP
jgi:hypothetical protein